MLHQLIARAGFAMIKWHSRDGLCSSTEDGPDASKERSKRLGVSGELYAYWYLRRLGYIFIARNYSPLRAKGELDLVGFDGGTLVIVEVRTREVLEDQPAQPELSITKEKHEVLLRTAHYFLHERHIRDCPLRFDVVAIDNKRGKPPIVRLHKAALSPQFPMYFQ
jgi:putative endonuclease